MTSVSINPVRRSITRGPRNLAILVVAVLAFTGCKSGYEVSSDVTINGHRKLTRTIDGVERKIEAGTDVEMEDGKITKFPKAALVKIQQSGGDGKKRAELRENRSVLELWMEEKGTFRRGSPADEAWLEGFLKEVAAD